MTAQEEMASSCTTFGMDIRKNFFIERVAKHQNKLPRKMVKSPPLEMFKKCVVMAQEYMV